MTESLMTDAATTTEGATSQDAAPAVAAPALTPENAAASTASKEQPAAAATNGTDAERPAGDEGAKGDEGKPEGAPEKYEFASPEGVQLDPKSVEVFSEVAKELNLSQEAAQKVIDKVGPAMAARQAEALAQARADWTEGAKSDKEYGGDKLPENLAVAKKALDQFGTPELRTLLNESGLGNHPEVIRVFYRAGKAISEDEFVPGGAGRPTGSKDYATSLYPNQQS